MKIVEFRAMKRGNLKGFVTVETPSGFTLHDCTVMVGDNGPWVGLPSKPRINKDGQHIKDNAGKGIYLPVVEITDKDRRSKFSEGVIAALRDFDKEALT